MCVLGVLPGNDDFSIRGKPRLINGDCADGIGGKCKIFVEHCQKKIVSFDGFGVEVWVLLDGDFLLKWDFLLQLRVEVYISELVERLRSFSVEVIFRKGERKLQVDSDGFATGV